MAIVSTVELLLPFLIATGSNVEEDEGDCSTWAKVKDDCDTGALVPILVLGLIPSCFALAVASTADVKMFPLFVTSSVVEVFGIVAGSTIDWGRGLLLVETLSVLDLKDTCRPRPRLLCRSS